MEQILATARSLDGVLELAPAEGGPYPEIAWGDHFFYYAPDGDVPQNTQPYATIVTKDYPDDTQSRLGDGRWRVNIHVGRKTFVDLLDMEPKDASAPRHWGPGRRGPYASRGAAGVRAEWSAAHDARRRRRSAEGEPGSAV